MSMNLTIPPSIRTALNCNRMIYQGIIIISGYGIVTELSPMG